MDLWYGGCIIPIPIHLEDFACPDEPKNMSWLCGELYYVTCVGHLSGEE